MLDSVHFGEEVFMLICLAQLRCQYFKITTTARKYRCSSCVHSLVTERQHEFRGKKNFSVRVTILGVCV